MMQRGHARTGKSYIEQNYDRRPDGRLEKNISIIPYHIILDPVKGELTSSKDDVEDKSGGWAKKMFDIMFDEEKTRLFKLGVIK